MNIWLILVRNILMKFVWVEINKLVDWFILLIILIMWNKSNEFLFFFVGFVIVDVFFIFVGKLVNMK